jgi:hypothetical protein
LRPFTHAVILAFQQQQEGKQPMPEDRHVRAEHFRRMNAYRDNPTYKSLETDNEREAFFAGEVGRKWETNEAVYDEFLNLLPPMGWRGGSFYMSEFLFGDITHRFSHEGDRNFCEVANYPPRAAPGARPQGPADPGPT